MWLFLLSILLVVIYRFVPPPITATMVGDVVAGRGLKKDWMSLDEMDRDTAPIGADTANSASTTASTLKQSRMR